MKLLSLVSPLEPCLILTTLPPTSISPKCHLASHLPALQTDFDGNPSLFIVHDLIVVPQDHFGIENLLSGINMKTKS